MKIFYQSSLPRSGSTLLQNILAQNPLFHVTPTSGLLELIYAARTNYTAAAEFRAQESASMRKSFLAFCKGGMTAYADALTRKPYMIDKSRGWGIHFDFLCMIFGEAPKIICMVRDLRQIISSMEKLFRQNGDKHRPIENPQAVTGTTTNKRVAIWMHSAPVGVAVDRLQEIFHRGWHQKFLFIRFEDLTRDPAGELRRVYDYLDLIPFPHRFDQVAQSTVEDDSVYSVPYLHQIRPAVAPLPFDYLDILGEPAARYIEAQQPWYFSTFNYPLTK